jgi:histone acetyltransferase MYST1
MVKRRGRGGAAAGTKTTTKPTVTKKNASGGALANIEAMAGAFNKDVDENKDVDSHPLAVNHYLVVRYRDDSPRLAKILGVGGRTPQTQQYYVHYFDFNRRMDEWVKLDRILIYPSSANALGKERSEAEDLIHKQKHEAEHGAATVTKKESSQSLNRTASTDTLNQAPIKVKKKTKKRGDDNGPAYTGPKLKRSVSNVSAISLVSMRSEGSSQVDGEHDDAMLIDDDDDENYDGEDVYSQNSGDELDDYLSGSEMSETSSTQASRKGVRQSAARGNLLSSPSGSPRKLYDNDVANDKIDALTRNMADNRTHMLSLVGNTVGTGSQRQDITNMEELEHDEHEGLEESALREHEELTKIKNFNTVLLGEHIMECWYFSPFPREYWLDAPVECIYFCEYTLRFFSTKDELVRYQTKRSEALPRHPPGNELYRDNKVSMFEVDGAVEKTYCQNLSYFAKLFLDHKTLLEDVDVFLFYVLCTHDNNGFHPVGYFSKNKFSDYGYNLACILTFPSAQRKGFGKFLISFSYELSKKENKLGSPEKPLSDLGNLSYRSYWANAILNCLKDWKESEISVMDICRITSIVASDVILTLDMLELLYTVESDGDDAATDGCSKRIIIMSNSIIEDLLLKYPPNILTVDPDKLHWAPLYITDQRRDKWTISAKMSVAGEKLEDQLKKLEQYYS